jgi:spermidine synthase
MAVSSLSGSAATGGVLRPPMLLWGGTILLSAFLLFQVQPLTGRLILPWFGGAPAVWTTCMLFFQSVLFGGYLYAHLLTARLSLRLQLVLHLLLLLAAAVLLRLSPDASWKPTDSSVPIPRILLLLATTAGLPCFVLSTTSPLLLRWLAAAAPHEPPHRLYALSNAGSLAALLLAPVVLDPLLPLSSQTQVFTWSFRGFAAACAACVVWLHRRTAILEPVVSPASAAQSGLPQSAASASAPAPLLRWFFLACLASVMLLSGTSTICQDVAVIPFLWIAPLTLYLLSFILCFESDRWYRRGLFAPLTALLVPFLSWLHLFGLHLHLAIQLSAWMLGLFCVFMLCHGEVARLRPGADRLTLFYLILSAGGVCGGLLCAVAAPLLLPALWDHHFALLFSGGLACAVWFDERGWLDSENRPPLPAAAAAIAVAAVVLLDLAASITEYSDAIAGSRNFYGELRVEDYPEERAVLMKHGRIIHGLQFRGLPAVPTMYYGFQSGVGRAVTALRNRADAEQRGLRIGLVGLGTGTLAAWGRPQDQLVFYEINPDVVRLAQAHFSFLKDCRGKVDIVEGDARLSLEFEEPRQFDLLVLDAFSGDSIPIHLLTREALAVCRRHLAPQGILAVHISNLHFNLARLTAGLADDAGMACIQLTDAVVLDSASGRPMASAPGSRWSLLAETSEPLRADVLQQTSPAPAASERVVWTDDYSNLLQLIE